MNKRCWRVRGGWAGGIGGTVFTVQVHTHNNAGPIKWV